MPGRIERYHIEISVATAAAELCAGGKTRPAIGARNHGWRRQSHSRRVAQAASLRRRQPARRRRLELCLDDLFSGVRSNLDHAFIVTIAGVRYAEHVLAGRN